MEAQNIPLSNLLLDPNNYRLQEAAGFVPYPEDRFHIDRVQETTRKRLRAENLSPLKNSIVANGYLEIERIVVVPYTQLEGKYVVVEGNRRVASLIMIQEDHDAGIEFPQKLIDVLDAVPCLVAGGEQEEAYFREAIMGIRHVGGIREWGGYQRAKLVADLRDKHNLDATSISDRIGLSVIEVNRRYRAFKALEQMQKTEDYAEYATPSLYPIFHEAVSLPTVRDWLGWNAEDYEFKNIDALDSFYQLICPRVPEEGEERPAKIKTYSDVRLLREIIPNQEAKADLLNLDRELVDALTVANSGRITSQWRSEINEAKVALKGIPALELASFNSDDLNLLKELSDLIAQIITLHDKTAG